VPGLVAGDPAGSTGLPARGPAPTTARRRPGRLVVGVLGFVALGLGLGALAGVAWWRLTTLPAYRLAQDGQAATNERGLTQVISGDAWFAAVGAVVGLLLGLVAWRRFRDLGWPVVLLGTLTALAAALVCWAVGLRLGPQHFSDRLAAARPGDLVPVDLALRARVALVVWPFLAVTPILLGSSLGRDDEEPRPFDAGSPPAEQA
jgi:hypothetical protein